MALGCDIVWGRGEIDMALEFGVVLRRGGLMWHLDLTLMREVGD